VQVVGKFPWWASNSLSNEFEGEKREVKVDVCGVVHSTEVVSDDCGRFGDDSTHRLSSSRCVPKRAFLASGTENQAVCLSGGSPCANSRALG
jgi:hypothetical protein